MKLGLINCQSACNKSDLIRDHILDHGIDILALTETWFRSQTDHNVAATTPNGYQLIHAPRKGRRGGGVALVYNSALKASLTTEQPFSNQTPSPTSSEYIQVDIMHDNRHFRLIVVYRPPPSPKHRVPFSSFIDEFSKLLNQQVLFTGTLIVLGDFNVHWNENTAEAKLLSAVIQQFNLQQMVDCETHKSGHTIDLIITSRSETLLKSVYPSEFVSDHCVIHCILNLQKPKFTKRQVSYRKLKSIDLSEFQHDLIASPLITNPATSLDSLADQYNRVLGQLLNNHATLKKHAITDRPAVPWYNESLTKEKRRRRQLERKWRNTKNQIDHDNFKAQRDLVKFMFHQAKSDYYHKKIQGCAGDQKALFKITNHLMHRSSTPKLPTCSSHEELASRFSAHFVGKIHNIRDSLQAVAINLPPAVVHHDSACQSSLTTFAPASEEEIIKTIKMSPPKSSPLDPLPTQLVKNCLDTLAGPITRLINMSFEDGQFPSSFKAALVTPVIKKDNLDCNDMNNYRPISNLSFVSKVVERAVADRLNAHLTKHRLRENQQSAYRKLHSVETALVSVHNDIMCAVDAKKAVLLVLLDLSAAFDTIDHAVLLERLNVNFGIKGLALTWLQSYLSNRRQAVQILGASSAETGVPYGVPQGSVLGPVLFTLYTSPLGHISRKHGLQSHFYADDTQLYTTFCPTISGDDFNALHSMTSCLHDIQEWMAANFLKFNSQKTKFLIICSPQLRNKFHIPNMQVGDAQVVPCSDARNLGVLFDQHMTFEKHVSHICQTSYAHLRRIATIRRMLTNQAAEQLIHAFITSRLDFCNSLLSGLSNNTLRRLQLVQNAAARLLTGHKKSTHITPIFQALHWLPIQYRIQYKIILLTFKALHGSAPDYLQSLLQVRSSRSGLRSSGKSLFVPRTRLSSYGDRAFSSAAPRLWNSLPVDLRETHNPTLFAQRLKTHLYVLAFPS